MSKITIDNFDNIIEHLSFPKFPNDTQFYYVQLIYRGKDGNPGMNGDNKTRLIRSYAITSAECLRSKKDEIINICRACNARAYIHPTRRSTKKVAKEMCLITTTAMVNEEWDRCRLAYNTACGKTLVTSDKKFIIDLDGKFATPEYRAKVRSLLDAVEPTDTDKFLWANPTPHGMHFITAPFNVGKFREVMPEIDVHRNNPTVLWAEVTE